MKVFGCQQLTEFQVLVSESEFQAMVVMGLLTRSRIWRSEGSTKLPNWDRFYRFRVIKKDQR